MGSGPRPLLLPGLAKVATEPMSTRNMRTHSLTRSSRITALNHSVPSHSPTLSLYSSRSLGMLALDTPLAAPHSPPPHSSPASLSFMCNASMRARRMASCRSLWVAFSDPSLGACLPVASAVKPLELGPRAVSGHQKASRPRPSMA